jgi:alkylation response protein AidB-like acyl-CoA dehydrogenase
MTSFVHPPEHLSPAELDALAAVRAFVAEQVAPKTREWERNAAFDDCIWPRLGDAGLLGILLSPEYGGRGGSTRFYCECVREIAKGDPALAMNVAAINALVAAHIEHFGTREQRDKYLPGVAKGEVKLAWGLTEPDAGSDARRVRTQAVPTGEDGWYALSGTKMFITNGGKADLIVVMAKTDEKTLTAFLVETAQPGFHLDRRISTVGVTASNTVQFTLREARGWHTPCTFEQALSLLYRGRLGIAAMAVGIAERAAELALEYAQSREQFNRRLADMQSVQNMLADNLVDVSAAYLLTMQGAKRMDAGEVAIAESSMAKLFASEAANRVTNRAIQIHGGRGMTPDFLVEKLWRDAKLTEIGEGCSEIQRMILAKRQLS